MSQGSARDGDPAGDPHHERFGLTAPNVAADPDRLYQGLEDATLGGDIPERRPVALNDSWHFLKVISELNPLPAGYRGTWQTPCVNHGDGSSTIQQLVVGATTYTTTTTRYTGASCTGDTSVTTQTGSLNDAGTVTANFGGTSVSAMQLDVTVSDQLPIYTLAYVDTQADPDQLYLGLSDAGDHNASMPERRPVALDSSQWFVKQ